MKAFVPNNYLFNFDKTLVTVTWDHTVLTRGGTAEPKGVGWQVPLPGGSGPLPQPGAPPSQMAVPDPP